MGIFDGLFGGGSSKTTTKSEYNGDTKKAQDALMGGVLKGIDPYLSAPSPFIAPMNDFQTRVGSGSQSLYDAMVGSNQAGTLGDYASRYSALGDTSSLLSSMGALNPYIGGYSQNAINSSTVGMDDIMGLANPFAQQMMDTQQRNLDRSYDTTQRDIGARAAAGGAFGGSGEAIERAMANRDYMEQSRDLASQVAYDSYGQGAQLATQNAGARTAALQSAGNDIYNRALGSRTYDDNLRNDAFSRQMQSLSGASNYDLSRAGFNNTAFNDYGSRVTSGLGLLGGYGDTLRDYNQQVGDAPWTQFQRLAGFIPSYKPTVTEKTPNQGGGLLGALATGLGATFKV